MFDRSKLSSSIDLSVPSHEYIFHRLFKCIVNQMDITSKDYLKRFGTQTSGDIQIDREMANQPIVTYKCIADMVDLFRDNAPIKVPSMSDCKLIYEYVDYHIQSWANVVQHSLNLGNAPLSDLIEMDKFATKLYPYVLDNKTIMENSSVFAQHLGGNYVTFDNVLGSYKSPFQIEEEAKKEQELIPQRDSYADVFVARSKSWR